MCGDWERGNDDSLSQAERVPGGESGKEVWEELIQLGEEIGRGWQSPLTSAELLSQMRR